MSYVYEFFSLNENSKQPETDAKNNEIIA